MTTIKNPKTTTLFLLTVYAPLIGRLGIVLSLALFIYSLVHIRKFDYQSQNKATHYLIWSALIYFAAQIAFSLQGPIDFVFLDLISLELIFLLGPLILLVYFRTPLDIDFQKLSHHAAWVNIAVLVLGIIAKYLFDINRPGLMPNNPITTSVLVAINLVISTWFWSEKSGRDKGIAALSILAAVIFIVVIAQARGATLALLGAFSVFAVLLVWRPKFSIARNLAHLVMIGIVGLIGLGATAYLVRDVSAFERYTDAVAMIAEFPEIKPKVDKNTATRLYQYEAAIEAIEADPWTGYGVANRYRAVIPYLDREFVYRFVHNFTLDQLLVGGPIALLIALNLLFAPLVIYRLNPARDTNLLVTATFIVVFLFIVGLTDRVFTQLMRNNSYFFLLFLLSIYAVKANNSVESLNDNSIAKSENDK